jgi:CotH kinase protein
MTVTALFVPATAAQAASAPLVSLLPTEGSVKVDCGPLPAGASTFRITYRRSLLQSQTVTLPAGATTATAKLILGASYSVTCSSRSGLFWSANSPATKALYPDLTLPVLRIDTANAAPIVDRENYVAATVSLSANGAANVTSFTGTGKIRGRGNSTWDAPTPKKPYKLKLDTAVSMLGMPADTDWALSANFYDRTQLRNAIAYYWGRNSSLAWTPKLAFAEVVLNGDYRGIYQVNELVDIAPDRVNIDKMGKKDLTGAALTGGYIAELDYKAEDEFVRPDDIVHFHAAITGAPFTIKEPDPPADAQIAYFKQSIDSVESAIAATTPTSSLAAVNSVLNTQSLVDWFVVSELARNHDSWYTSTYMYKPRNGLVTMGPLWDFDLSMGTYFLESRPYNDAWLPNRSPWIAKLMENTQFKALFTARYRAQLPAINQTFVFLDSLDQQIRAARANDAVRWGYTQSMSTEVSNLKTWLLNRKQWLEQYYQV